MRDFFQGERELSTEFEGEEIVTPLFDHEFSTRAFNLINNNNGNRNRTRLLKQNNAIERPNKGGPRTELFLAVSPYIVYE